MVKGLGSWLASHGRDHAELWDPEDDAVWRGMLGYGNDGIIASAAIIQGLIAGGATGHDALVGVVAMISIGMVGAASFEYSQCDAARISYLATYEAEKARLETHPADEYESLAKAYEAKGLTPELAHQVATQLMAKDPLQAVLDTEFSLSKAPSRWWPIRRTGYAALSYLLGATMPLLFLLVLPWEVRAEVTVVFVAVALAVSGWVGHFVEHTTAWRSMLRTVLVGLLALGVSTIAGGLVRF